MSHDPVGPLIRETIFYSLDKDRTEMEILNFPKLKVSKYDLDCFTI